MAAMASRVSVPRGWQAAGSVYAILAGRRRNEDFRSAQEWYRRAGVAWRKFEGQPGFSLRFRAEADAAAKALAALGASSR